MRLSAKSFCLGFIIAWASQARAVEPNLPRLVIVIAEGEYETHETLPVFAREFLEEDFCVRVIEADEEDPNSIPEIDCLAEADLVLLSIRRRTLLTEQLQVIRDYVAAGKPIVAIRTSSHAFSLRSGTPPEGYEQWPQFDAQVLGGNYHDHYPNDRITTVTVSPGATGHPILADVDSPFSSTASLYMNRPLAEGAVPLLQGTVEGEPSEPIAWTHVSPAGGRVFTTSLGNAEDFENEAFQQLLAGGIAWAMENKEEAAGD